MSTTFFRLVLLMFVLTASTTGCSLNKFAVNKMGNALAGGGDTYASDDDPELIRDATPFTLKLMESLLAVNPRHEGLLLAAASGFTQYAYAFVHQNADELEDVDIAAAEAGWTRAAKLYLRGRNYGLRGLEVRHSGFQDLLVTDLDAAIAETDVEDVPSLYWTAVAWTAAISLSKNNTDLVGDLPVAEALIDRALSLDEDFDNGAIHGFLITYEMSRQGGEGDPAARAREHFTRAVALSDGKLAQPFVALAEAVAVVEQNRQEFESLLNTALAIDPDEKTAWRMNNLVSQRRARWLLGRTEQLFLN
jgi:predicted anti-sigma-YlaC factor YlaD